jgi:hypothetical protein
LQDRLVKELRRAGANDLESANRVLAAYLPKFNARFQIEAAQSGSAYLPWPPDRDPAHYFCFKYTRTVTNDNTIPFNNHRLQIPPGPGRKSYAKARVELHHSMDGSLAVFYLGQHLVTFPPATSAPPRVGLFQPATPATPPAKPQATTLPKPPRQPWKPPPDHPWKQSRISLKGRKLG